MISLDGYTLGACLRTSARRDVYEARREADGLEVVIKSYASGRVTDTISRAEHEYEAIRKISSAGVVRAIELDRSQRRPALVLEHFRGIQLEAYLAQQPLDADAFLRIAIQIADALVAIHAARIIHKDLKPGNILIDPATLEIRIIDFGVSAEIGETRRHSRALQGTLPYIAPEQTGRMDRGVDFRSDLYSLGAMFFELLAGRPPFVSDDPLELIHSHIARRPIPPTEIRSTVPEALSRIALKLLEKAPEDRYQTARALAADLRECSAQLAQTGGIEAEIRLATFEEPSGPLFGGRLYGREPEIAALREAYARAASGSAEFFVLSGPPGIGKSALPGELSEAIASSGGYLACGKFDLYRRDRPYAALVSAFQSLVEQILTESDSRLQVWRVELLAAFGNIGQAMADLVPDLGLILDDLLPIPRLGALETRQRLGLAVRRFLRACATKDHPLVLLLDDLQWADAGSRYLIEDLLVSDDASGLLLIGTYRSGDLEDSHPLLQMISRLEARSVRLQHCELPPLSSTDCAHMLADALDCSSLQTRELAEIIASKTGSLPLLIQQFMLFLHEEGCLRYELGAGWVWDVDEIAAANAPEDIAGLMTAKIERLEDSSRDILKFASCVGDEFDVELLVDLTDRDRSLLDSALHALVDEGLVVPCREGFRFVHDRVREAAQALWSDEERSRLHHDAAILLLEKTPPEALPGRSFEIADHLNRAADRISQAERVRVTEINLMAAKRALGKGAAATADGYLAMGREFFSVLDWRDHPELAFDLLLQSAESALQTRRFDEALRLLGELEARPLSSIQFAQVVAKRIPVYALTKGPDETVRLALAALRRLGVRLSMRPSLFRVWGSLLLTDWILRGRSQEGFFQRATELPEKVLASLIITGKAGASMMRTDIGLATLIACRAMRIHIRRGYVARPALTLASYTSHRSVFMKRPGTTRRYSEVAHYWNERAFDPFFSIQTDLTLSAFVDPWLMSRRRAIQPLAGIRDAFSEAGDNEYMLYAGFLSAFYGGLGGVTVPAIEKEFREMTRVVRQGSYRYEKAPACLRVHRLLRFSAGDTSDLEAVLQEHEELLNATPEDATFLRTYWMMVLCIHGRYRLAFEQSERLGRDVYQALAVSPHVADFCFFRGLSAAVSLPSTRGRERRKLRRELRRSLRRLRRWARAGPDFAHQARLLEAESARIAGDPERALALYRSSSERAAAQGYRHHAGLAEERGFSLAFELGQDEEAARRLHEALSWYDAWGADRKVIELGRENEALLEAFPVIERAATLGSRHDAGDPATSVHRPTSSADTARYDLSTVLRAFEAISQEVDLDQVVDRVMGIALENAGARRAVLLLDHDGELRLEAERSLDREACQLRDSLPLGASGSRLPVTLALYVQRTRKTVVLGDAGHDTLFAADPYIVARAPRSVLCVPIMRQAKLVGVLYLENDLVAAAFTEGRVEILGLLSVHAAISIDNARLYRELTELNRSLEIRVERRTEELLQARNEAQNATLAKSQFLAAMSHEIRTPMNVVIGMTQILEDTELGADQRDCLQAVHTAGDSLLNVINDILDFSKIEAGKLELEQIPFSLRECVEEVAGMLSAQAQEKGLELPVFVDRTVPDRFVGDPGRLKQIAINLVNNAIKFTERGDVELRVWLGTDDGPGTQVCFEVRDTGIGIPRHRLAGLFQSYAQLAPSAARSYGGTGLGLVISKRLAETMGGSIGVESEEGIGSCFRFDVRLAVDASAAESEILPESETLQTLVMAAHPRSGEAVCERIRGLGASAALAADPDLALTRIRAGDARAPQAVLLRYPLENAEWSGAVDALRQTPGLRLFWMAPVRKRAEAERELASAPGGVLPWPPSSESLRGVLAQLLGIEIERSEPASRLPDANERRARAEWRILVAEDYPLNQKLAVRLLERAGYSADVVDDGQKAVDAVASGAYDLLLIDCQMPVMDGFDAAREIRRREEGTGTHIPILAMTAQVLRGARQRCLDSGMDDYLSKPIQVSALYELLEKHLKDASK